MDGGAKVPSSKWKVRYGLMLGLERILAAPEPRTASGTALRKHQIDALAGMLTELIAASQKYDEAAVNGNGNGHAATAEEIALSDAMLGYWTRFAKAGDPNGGAVAWPKYDVAGDASLELGTPIAATTGLKMQKCDFWDSLR